MTYGKTWLNKHGHPMGRVFEIVNMLSGDNYIGHTTMPIKKRLYQSITAANSGRGGLLYDNIREYGKEAFEVRVLHECTLDEDVILKERELLKTIQPTLNKNI